MGHPLLGESIYNMGAYLLFFLVGSVSKIQGYQGRGMWYSYKTCGGKEWVAKAACGNPAMGMTASCWKDFQVDPSGTFSGPIGQYAEKGCALRFGELNPGISVI